ncbi:hypothetical protein UA08_09459 [Talaromyces atroroseus]|uniref:O-methyltransferase domain-containing protein n=1 Tax=Talaromyces atroroseus TaxID=1441469 RepID=A0A225A567_TALAT|nr:hypothetical protein UA08_09459 [Talaromyces atroroseus]OKL55302.1 hypothetical protein UA08_09459 [Talaromyces atroroseus]
MKAIYKLPEFFRSTGYRNPDDATAGPFQFAYETSQHWFQWVSDRPAVCQQFNHHMSAYHQGRPSWMDHEFYPVENDLLNLVKPGPNTVLLVDIGGGFGHDLQKFRQKHPSAPGRLIVQDKADVIRQGPIELEKVEFMAHDFFTEQPIKGLNELLVPSAPTNFVQVQGRTIFTQSYMIGLMQNAGVSYDISRMQWPPDIANYSSTRTLSLTKKQTSKLPS